MRGIDGALRGAKPNWRPVPKAALDKEMNQGRGGTSQRDEPATQKELEQTHTFSVSLLSLLGKTKVTTILCGAGYFYRNHLYFKRREESLRRWFSH